MGRHRAGPAPRSWGTPSPRPRGLSRSRRGPVRRARWGSPVGGTTRPALAALVCVLLLLGGSRAGSQVLHGGGAAASLRATAVAGGGGAAPLAAHAGTAAAPLTSASPAEVVPVTVVAAGDIACAPGTRVTRRQCQQVATSSLALRQHPDAVLPLGDNQYEAGSIAEYRASYAASWGRLDAIAHPVPGNHEYGWATEKGNCSHSRISARGRDRPARGTTRTTSATGT